MQTFLPYPSFEKSAKALDNKRLQKQIVECQQLLNALTNSEAKGWKNHPAALMWKGHEGALAEYMLVCWTEWKNRGFGPDHKSVDWLKSREFASTPSPSWIGRDDFHAAHRSNLLRKNPDHYAQFGWTESPDLEYVWPSKETA
jgi:hypothetical protein